MPATAGRIRMPANNRVHSSAALQTHSIWQSAIRYDPYAPATTNTTNNPKPDTDNVYNSFQDLLTLARITGSNTSETRGACKKCHRVGHLTFQCRNFLSLKPKSDDADVIYQTMNADPKEDDVIKKAKEDSEEEEEDDEDEISSSDSDVDPEMERIIAERFGKSMSKMSKIDDDDDEERKKRKERSRSRHHRRRHRHHRRRHRRSKRERDSDDSSSSESSPDEGYEKRSVRHRRKRRTRHRERRSVLSSRSVRHRRKRRTRHRERRSVLSSGSESTGSSSDEDERRRRERRERKLSCVAR